MYSPDRRRFEEAYDEAKRRKEAAGLVEVGRELIAQKAALGHGHFEAWIDAEFEMSADTALNLMRVASRYGENRSVRDLKPTVLYMLAAPSTPDVVRDIVEAAVVDGEAFTAADIKALKKTAADARAALSDADRKRVDDIERERAVVDGEGNRA